LARTLIKVCGITSVADAKAAVAAGVDAIGLVFYAASPRYVEPEQALEIARAVGPFVTVVGLFVNAEAEAVQRVLEQVPLHLLQFHGDEDLAYCSAFKRPYMKAIRMRPELDVEAQIAAFPTASAILLDAYRPGVPGGTGETFDWRRVPVNASAPLVLAGGLTPDNVAQAIAATHVYGVDVSGGVESSAGVKDADKIQVFINNARCGA
jgi:phosphoribosylanthranilate isomerase